MSVAVKFDSFANTNRSTNTTTVLNFQKITIRQFQNYEVSILMNLMHSNNCINWYNSCIKILIIHVYTYLCHYHRSTKLSDVCGNDADNRADLRLPTNVNKLPISQLVSAFVKRKLTTTITQLNQTQRHSLAVMHSTLEAQLYKKTSSEN